ncbi:UNVERIFIED_CONTAM: hypothetical protein NCL1_24053 [Trichonephila clavipes]
MIRYLDHWATAALLQWEEVDIRSANYLSIAYTCNQALFCVNIIKSKVNNHAKPSRLLNLFAQLFVIEVQVSVVKRYDVFYLEFRDTK